MRYFRRRLPMWRWIFFLGVPAFSVAQTMAFQAAMAGQLGAY